MAKALLLNALHDALSDYVVGLSPERLKVGVWSGKIVLEELQVGGNGLDYMRTDGHGLKFCLQRDNEKNPLCAFHRRSHSRLISLPRATVTMPPLADVSSQMRCVRVCVRVREKFHSKNRNVVPPGVYDSQSTPECAGTPANSACSQREIYGQNSDT